ncbi:MAG: hypothetical protein ACO1QB_14300 [Verrucomicrobiales bacterium]
MRPTLLSVAGDHTLEILSPLGKILHIQLNHLEMKIQKWLSFMFLLSGVTGCLHNNGLMLRGEYYDSQKRTNFISFQEGMVRIHITGVDPRDEHGDGLQFKYVLEPNGKIHLRVLSHEYGRGYSGLRYFYYGNKIVAQDVKQHLEWTFVK